MDKSKRPSLKFFLGLHLAILVFSFSGVFSKMASHNPMFSWKFVLLYGLSLLVCGVYAILWQQFLKYIPLNTAYSNRIVSMIWSMLWGAILFHEVITVSMVIGTVVILFGVRIVATSDE